MKEYREKYEKYLSSKKWKEIREKIAKNKNYTCEKCQKKIYKGFHIHHLNYNNLGNEKDSDLIFLCKNCHEKIHNRENKNNKTLKIKNDILKNEDFISLTNTSKVLYFYIKMWAGDKKTFYYSYSLANKIIGSRTTIYRSIIELQNKGFIHVCKDKNKNLFTIIK